MTEHYTKKRAGERVKPVDGKILPDEYLSGSCSPGGSDWLRNRRASDLAPPARFVHNLGV
jgi:hypothetical protein